MDNGCNSRVSFPSIDWVLRSLTFCIGARFSLNAPSVRSGHTAVYRPGAQELVVFGGFNGVALNDVAVFAVPSQFCSRHQTSATCLADPSNCTWNATAGSCMFTTASGIDLLRRNSSTADCLTAQQACSAFVLVSLSTQSFSRATVSHCTNLEFSCLQDESLWFNGLSGINVRSSCDSCYRNPFCSECVTRPPPRNPSIRCTSPNATQCAPNGTLLPSTGSSAKCSTPCAQYSGSCAECNDVGAALGCVFNFTGQGHCYSSTNNVTASCTQISCADRVGRANCSSGSSCHWCESSETCHDATGIMTEYSFGQCFEYSGDPTRYSCESETSCSTCVSTSRCGWCDNGNGTGVCTSGTPGGPGNGTCSGVASTNPTPNMTYSWNWWVCPPQVGAQVNPCDSNGSNVCGPNSTCTPIAATAVFTASYRCTCGVGYTLATNGSVCVPSCSAEACVHGTCTAPGVCTCNLGWYGDACDRDCLCNDHSTCTSGPGQCDSCQDGSTGPFCHACRGGFYGNGTRDAPPYSGTCAACIDACNGRSSSCKSSPADPGPVCTGCDGHSHGDFCHQCDAGYFIDPAIQSAAFALNSSNGGLSWSRQEREVNTSVLHAVEVYLLNNLTVNMTCTPCQCNGHSGTCDPVTGENCACQNYTQTDTLTAQTNNLCYQSIQNHGSCYDTQCSACLPDVRIDGQLWKLQSPSGGPTNGTLCYINIDEMQMQKGVLGNQSIISFALHKRFINVDMRIYVRASNPQALNVYVLEGDRAAFIDGQVQTSSQLPIGIEEPLSEPSTTFGVDSSTSTFAGSIYVYVVLEARAGNPDPSSEYEVFFAQAQVTNLHLFIFFTSFFCCFYLVVFFLGALFALKAAHGDRLLEEQEAVEMENLSCRPSANARLLAPAGPLNSAQARAVVELQAQDKLATTPISWQPHRSGRAAVATFVLEFPGSADHRTFSLGYGLVAIGGKDGLPRQSEDEPDAMHGINGDMGSAPNSPTAQTPMIREARL